MSARQNFTRPPKAVKRASARVLTTARLNSLKLRSTPVIITATMSEEGRKRSRFDQTEPEPKRRESRFDRRSRSPSGRNSERRRSRSPINRQASDSPATAERKDPQAAAAAAAARINAQIQAKKGIQHVDVPPIRSVCPRSHRMMCEFWDS